MKHPGKGDIDCPRTAAEKNGQKKAREKRYNLCLVVSEDTRGAASSEDPTESLRIYSN